MVVHALLICLNWAHYPFVKLDGSFVPGYAKTFIGAYALEKVRGGTLGSL
jgi:hypothetical protein